MGYFGTFENIPLVDYIEHVGNIICLLEGIFINTHSVSQFNC